jgi:hypothetical protein
MGHIDHPSNQPASHSAKSLIATIITGVAILAGCTMAVHSAKKKQAQHIATSEAIDELDRIYKRSSRYFTVPHVDVNTGKLIDCQFPADQGMTPDVTNKN